MYTSLLSCARKHLVFSVYYQFLNYILNSCTLSVRIHVYFNLHFSIWQLLICLQPYMLLSSWAEEPIALSPLGSQSWLPCFCFTQAATPPKQHKSQSRTYIHIILTFQLSQSTQHSLFCCMIIS